MATNPQAEGQTRINFQISEEEKAALQMLADASGMKLSAYIRKVLDEAVSGHTIFETRAVPRQKEALSFVAEDQSPYGVNTGAAGKVLRARAAAKANPPTAPAPTPPAPPTGSP